MARGLAVRTRPGDRRRRRLDRASGRPAHPGRCSDALELPPDALDESYGVLAEFGNMSSPTVLFILDRMRHDVGKLPCVMLAFGPGLTIEGALLLLGKAQRIAPSEAYELSGFVATKQPYFIALSRYADRIVSNRSRNMTESRSIQLAKRRTRERATRWRQISHVRVTRSVQSCRCVIDKPATVIQPV